MQAVGFRSFGCGGGAASALHRRPRENISCLTWHTFHDGVDILVVDKTDDHCKFPAFGLQFFGHASEGRSEVLPAACVVTCVGVQLEIAERVAYAAPAAVKSCQGADFGKAPGNGGVVDGRKYISEALKSGQHRVGVLALAIAVQFGAYVALARAVIYYIALAVGLCPAVLRRVAGESQRRAGF